MVGPKVCCRDGKSQKRQRSQQTFSFGLHDYDYPNWSGAAKPPGDNERRAGLVPRRPPNRISQRLLKLQRLFAETATNVPARYYRMNR